MRRIEYPKEDIAQFTYYSIYHEHPIVRRRMLVHLLKSLGLPHWKIAETAGISGTTLREYLDLYVEGGIEARRVAATRQRVQKNIWNCMWRAGLKP